VQLNAQARLQEPRRPRASRIPVPKVSARSPAPVPRPAVNGRFAASGSNLARSRETAPPGKYQPRDPRRPRDWIWCGAVTTSPWLLEASSSSLPDRDQRPRSDAIARVAAVLLRGRDEYAAPRGPRPAPRGERDSATRATSSRPLRPACIRLREGRACEIGSVVSPWVFVMLGEVVKDLVPRCLRANEHVSRRFEVRLIDQ
jgi:hypothetical protein